MRCLACKYNLNEQDIEFKDIKAVPNLVGYNPIIIYDEYRKCLNFYLYQIHCDLEIAQQNKSDNFKELNEKIEVLNNKLQNYRIERHMLRDKVKKLEDALEMEKANVYEMDEKIAERNREMKRLEDLNEKLKFKSRIER